MCERARLRPRPRRVRAHGTADEALSRQRGARPSGQVNRPRGPAPAFDHGSSSCPWAVGSSSCPRSRSTARRRTAAICSRASWGKPSPDPAPARARRLARGSDPRSLLPPLASGVPLRTHRVRRRAYRDARAGPSPLVAVPGRCAEGG